MDRSVGLDIPLDVVLVTIFISHSYSSFNKIETDNTVTMAPRMVSVKLVFLKFSEKVNIVDFEKGNKIFDFCMGILIQNLKLKNHLKTLTMVSMETKIG